MRHNRLFAAGLAAALMLGAASPALADAANGKGKAKGQVNKPDKQKPPKKVPPAKKSHFAVSGGGSVAGGEVSMQARMRKPSNGHFNYTSTDGTFKVRCHDGWQAPETEPTLGAYPRTLDVTFNNCLITGLATRTPLTVTVTDNGQPPKTDDGQPAATPTLTDVIGFSVTAATATTATPYGGPLTDGNVKIRNK